MWLPEGRVPGGVRKNDSGLPICNSPSQSLTIPPSKKKSRSRSLMVRVINVGWKTMKFTKWFPVLPVHSWKINLQNGRRNKKRKNFVQLMDFVCQWDWYPWVWHHPWGRSWLLCPAPGAPGWPGSLTFAWPRQNPQLLSLAHGFPVCPPGHFVICWSGQKFFWLLT